MRDRAEGKEDHEFCFYQPGRLVDGDLELVLFETVPGSTNIGHVPVYRFRMVHPGQEETIGYIDLRVGNTHPIVMYAGHIGYRVLPEHWGQHYAARSCKLLFGLARQHGLNPLWITTNPDNIPSRRACELAGARLVEIVDLPE